MAKVAGSMWVEGNSLRFVDAYNREWYFNGVYHKSVAGTGALPGSIWHDNQSTNAIHYINWDGLAEFRAPANGLALVPLAGTKVGMIFTESRDATLRHLGVYDGANNLLCYNHIDVAQVSNHTDAHYDAPHSDAPHNDLAHTDRAAGNSHFDTHGDSPHYDFNDSRHGDFNDGAGNNEHYDFNDVIYYYHPQYLNNFLDHFPIYYHGDYNTSGGTYHNDYVESHGSAEPQPGINSRHDDLTHHGDQPHGDAQHTDTHTDSPHQDQSGVNTHTDHTDNTPHQDVDHIDTPHYDGHTDAHDDTHGDAPHNDEPILVGP